MAITRIIDINIAVFIVVLIVEFISQRETNSTVYSIRRAVRVASSTLLVLVIVELLIVVIIGGV